ncbi:hypothetical protein [Leyella stercorea]|jgi:hypothetical protein|uniref:hypothetical protein n=1 Tax=Leyella stercorea TaxID=363265 RepID=UPI002625422D|nr:hypothetical protein [Leyella stercorea]
MKVIANVKREPGEKNYSCLLTVKPIKGTVLGCGSSAKAAIEDMLKGWNETTEYLKEEGEDVPALEIEYRFDVGSLFSYYDFVNIAGVAREIGLNSSVIRQYVIGTRKPSAERKKLIITGLKSLADKMQQAVLY